MLCTKCGAALPEDARFCIVCGTPVAAPVVTPVVQQKAAPKKKEVYKGPSQMKSFRIVTGVLFLFGLVWLWANPLGGPIALLLQNRQSFVFSLPSFVISSVAGYLLPGLMSLILCRPTRVKSIILSVFFLFMMIFSGVLIFDNVILLSAQASEQVLFNYVLSISPVPFICFFWAVVSIFQPKKLVREPAPVLGRPWKIINGILHLISGAVFVVVSVIGMMVYLATREFTNGLEFMSVFMTLLVPGFYMLLSGIYSISTGAKAAKNELAATHLQFMAGFLCLRQLASFFLVQGIQDTFSGNGSAIVNLILVIAFALVALWYFLGALIQFITMLISKRKG